MHNDPHLHTCIHTDNTRTCTRRVCTCTRTRKHKHTHTHTVCSPFQQNIMNSPPPPPPPPPPPKSNWSFGVNDSVKYWLAEVDTKLCKILVGNLQINSPAVCTSSIKLWTIDGLKHLFDNANMMKPTFNLFWRV